MRGIEPAWPVVRFRDEPERRAHRRRRRAAGMGPSRARDLANASRVLRLRPGGARRARHRPVSGHPGSPAGSVPRTIRGHRCMVRPGDDGAATKPCAAGTVSVATPLGRGAEAGNRTRTPLRGTVFETVASASSATSAWGVPHRSGFRVRVPRKRCATRHSLRQSRPRRARNEPGAGVDELDRAGATGRGNRRGRRPRPGSRRPSRRGPGTTGVEAATAPPRRRQGWTLPARG